MTKDLKDMSDVEKMRRWIDIIEKGERGELSVELTESEDRSSVTIVVKKDENDKPT